MPIVRQTLVYDGPGGPFEGVIAYDDEVEAPRPGVLLAPNVLGQKEQDNQKAEELAKLGYVGFACDVFGQGKRTARGQDDSGRYMNELNADRPLLRPLVTAEYVHGKTGIDGVELAEPTMPLDPRHAADFIVETLMSRPAGSVTEMSSSTLNVP